MPAIDFDGMMEEIGDAQSMTVMQALVRSKLAHGADNRPAMLVLTENTLFWGGSEATGGRFNRIPLKSIVKSGRAGRFIWECIKVTHMEVEGERTVYVCPFSGDPAKPRKDRESMEYLLKSLGGV